MPTKHNELTKAEERWVKRLKVALRGKPPGIELIVGYGNIRIFQAGTLAKHIGSEHDGFDVDSNPRLPSAIIEIKVPLEAYTEGT